MGRPWVACWEMPIKGRDCENEMRWWSVNVWVFFLFGCDRSCARLEVGARLFGQMRSKKNKIP